MIKATNINTSILFSAECDWNETYINYKQVITFFKEFLVKINSNAFLKDSMYKSLQKAVKVMCPNPIISRFMDVEVYEVFMELNDKMLRAKRCKTFVEILSLLYTGEIGMSSPLSKLAK